MTLTRKEVNAIFGWIDEFAPRDPQRIRQDIEAAKDELSALRVELKESAKWHAQKERYELVLKHAKGKPLTIEEEDALGNIATQPYEDHEVEP